MHLCCTAHVHGSASRRAADTSAATAQKLDMKAQSACFMQGALDIMDVAAAVLMPYIMPAIRYPGHSYCWSAHASNCVVNVWSLGEPAGPTEWCWCCFAGIGVSGVMQRVSIVCLKIMTGDGNEPVDGSGTGAGAEDSAVQAWHYARKRGVRIINNR